MRHLSDSREAIMRATEHEARRIAAVRRLARADSCLDAAVALQTTIEEFVLLNANGPGGMAMLESEEVEILRLMLQGSLADVRGAIVNLNAAAELLCDE
jgi:hypothetical protein